MYEIVFMRNDTNYLQTNHNFSHLNGVRAWVDCKYANSGLSTRMYILYIETGNGYLFP